jgi:cell division transport system permease protein
MMDRWITLWRIMQAGTRNFFRNAWLSIAATVMMVVTLTVVLGAIILNVALNDTLGEVTKKIDIAIFFEDVATESDAKQLETDLRKDPNVTDVLYVSKTDALARYREQNKDNPALLEAINERENPLPSSLEVRVKDLKMVDPILELTKQEDYIPLIQDTSLGEDRKKTIERIANIKQFLLTAGLAASIVFAAVAILIIFNTIRIAIFSRSDELGIMRLIGATNSFIRGPFLFEAMLDGAVAAVITLVIVYITIFTGAPKVINYVNFNDTITFFENHWTLVGLGTIASGMLIGTISSVLAMVRYLKL